MSTPVTIQVIMRLRSLKNSTAISRDIDNFNASVRDLAVRAGARFLDVTATSRLAAADRTLLAADGLHPSSAMYEMWVDQLLPFATNALAAS